MKDKRFFFFLFFFFIISYYFSFFSSIFDFQVLSFFLFLNPNNFFLSLLPLLLNQLAVVITFFLFVILFFFFSLFVLSYSIFQSFVSANFSLSFISNVPLWYCSLFRLTSTYSVFSISQSFYCFVFLSSKCSHPHREIIRTNMHDKETTWNAKALSYC